jgi:hypothetical protein
VRPPSVFPFNLFMQLSCIVGYGHGSRGVVKLKFPWGKGKEEVGPVCLR